MKKFIYCSLILIFTSVISFAQTATDFTTDNCDGISHNLFNTLDSGNVIVIAWVMPCGPCATYTLPAYSAVQSFNLSHPDRVDFYLVDDFANTACPTLVNWGNSNNMPISTVFSSNLISMSDYGSNGMPKVVVLGGTSHSVYYNENDNKINFNGVQSAINNALSSSVNINYKPVNNLSLSVFPNPTNNFLNISHDTNNSDSFIYEIVNVLGETVYYSTQTEFSANSINIQNIDVSKLNNGVYFLNLYSQFSSESVRIVLVENIR